MTRDFPSRAVIRWGCLGSTLGRWAKRAKGWKTIGWREGSKGRLKSRFWVARVQPSHGFHEGKPPLKEVWLLVEWPESEQEPTKYFFCDLPADYSLRRLVRLTKCRW